MSSTRLERLRLLSRTLGFRLAAWHAALLLATGAAALVFSYVALAASLRAGDRARIASELEELSAAYRTGGPASVRAEAAAQRLLPGPSALIRLIARDGREEVLASPRGPGLYDLSALTRPSVPGAVAWSDAPRRDDEEALEVASLRLADGTILQAGTGTQARDEFLERFRGVAAAVLLPLVLLAATGGLIFTRRGLRPLRDLVTTTRAIETGALGSRVPVRGTGDELDELAVLFNRMLDKIAALVTGMRGALDDAAHDLRTPLTRLRGGAEIALRSGDGPEALREALADCVEESDEILAMLESLMDLSEAEAGTMRLRLEEVDARGLLEDAAGLYAPSAEEKGLRLAVEAPEGLRVRGDRARLRRAVANLVDNAVKYVPKGGRVVLSAARDGAGTVIIVTDDGPGIPPGDLPHVWDRLFRGDRSRSERGLGLGLSLVKAVVLAHGGRVEAVSAPGKGAEFRLLLPSSSPS
jgi:signal transduction histidine kinase